MATRSKARVSRESLLKELKKTEARLQKDIDAYEALVKEYKKSKEDWNKKALAVLKKKGRPEEVYGHKHGAQVTFTLRTDEFIDEIGAFPEFEWSRKDSQGYLQREPEGYERVETGKWSYSRKIDVIKETIWVLEHSDDEYVTSQYYADVVKFVI